MRNTSKNFALFLVLTIILNLSVLAIESGFAQTSLPSVGVRPGDWMEYNVVIGGSPPPIHNVNWLRIAILQVQGDTFQANFTVRYLNGTLYSTIWKFNFTSGDTGGWIIIPSSLSPGETFRDLFNSTTSNVTIQRQEQKTVTGATRTIIFANDSLRTKEWDKATGAFTNSSETFKEWSSHVYMTAQTCGAHKSWE
jgi:hypothetical protein